MCCLDGGAHSWHVHECFDSSFLNKDLDHSFIYKLRKDKWLSLSSTFVFIFKPKIIAVEIHEGISSKVAILHVNVVGVILIMCLTLLIACILNGC